MSEMAGLERGYQRLLAWYPAAFRRENEQEILGVLMAGARDGQHRPALAETADLIKGALRMRLRPGGPRPGTVLAALRLMYAGAALEIAALVTVIMTTGSLKIAYYQHNPGTTAAQWHSVLAYLTLKEVTIAIAAGLWLFLAWANGRGRDWARMAFMPFFALTTLALLLALGQDAAVYAPADLIAGGAVWLVALITMVLIFSNRSSPCYQREPARHQLTQRLARPGHHTRSRLAARIRS